MAPQTAISKAVCYKTKNEQLWEKAVHFLLVATNCFYAGLPTVFCTITPVPVGDAFFEQPLNTVFMTQLSIVFERILDSIQKVFSNLFGWIIALFSAYLAWLGNDSGSFLLVLIAIVWDMAWGIASAVKRHDFVLSYLLREMFCKIIVYVGAMSIVLLAERMLGLTSGLTVKIIAVIATSVELFSSAGNILIIKPDFVFVRVFGKYLVGEIADKMKISPDEARQILEDHKN